MRRRVTIAAMCACLSVVGRARALGEADPDVPRVDAADAVYGEELRRAYDGDPDLRAELQRRLGRLATVKVAPETYDDLLRATTLAAFYRLDEAGPVLARFYRETRGAFVAPIAEAAACYRTAEAERFQRTLLADPMLRFNRARTRLLIALAERGDVPSADTLALMVQGVDPQRTKFAEMRSMFDLLATARSEPLRDRVAALPPVSTLATRPATRPTAPVELSQRGAEADVIARSLPAARRLLSAQLDRALQSPEQSIDAIATMDRRDESAVAVALGVLSRSATPDDAARLMAMPLGVGPAHDGSATIERLRARVVALTNSRAGRPTAATTQPSVAALPPVIVVAPPRVAATEPPAKQPAGAAATIRLRLVPLKDQVVPKGDRVPPIVAKAKDHGVDLAHFRDPFVAFAYLADRKRVFYVFSNVIETTAAPRPWVLQRIRRTERFLDRDGRETSPPEVGYSVQAFTLKGGILESINQHEGAYSLGNLKRREITKELEIGFGEIAGLAEGALWPFANGETYKDLQDDVPRPELYERVRFTTSLKWSIKVTFAEGGTYSIACPEFGFDAPRKMPRPPAR